MPNINDVGNEKWSNYRVSIDEIESRTGDNRLSNVPIEGQREIEETSDKAVIQLVWVLPAVQ